MQGVWFLDGRASAYQFFKKLPDSFQRGCTFYIWSAACGRPSSFTSSAQFDVDTILFYFDHYDECEYFTVVLACISLMAHDAKHLFRHFPAICISSWVNCLFMTFARFLIGLSVSFLLRLCPAHRSLLLPCSLLTPTHRVVYFAGGIPHLKTPICSFIPSSILLRISISWLRCSIFFSYTSYFFLCFNCVQNTILGPLLFNHFR